MRENSNFAPESPLPISFRDVELAAQRISAYIQPTPCREYIELNRVVGNDIRVFVKHENHHPTNAFKVRNAFSALTALDPEARKRGVVAATKGNHGLGLCYAGALLGIPVTICVPHGNNPEKNSGMQALGANLIIEGKDYDDAIAVMDRLEKELGLTKIASTNNRDVIAGAATLSAELIKQAPDLDVLVLSVGGGSQAVGALVAAKELKPTLKVYGVQAEGASAIHDSWHCKKPLQYASANSIADGLATRSTYEMTFPALLSGLDGFVKVSEQEIVHAMRTIIRFTHNLVEGAGAAGLAGVMKLSRELRGKNVGIVISGGNVDQKTLRCILS